MPGIEFVTSFNHDPFVKSANAMLNSFRNMASQVERMGGDMQDVMSGIFDGTSLGKGMQAFFDGIIENFGLSVKAAEDFRRKAEAAITSIGSSGDETAMKINKIVTSVVQLASEAKQVDMSGIADSGAGSRSLEDMRVSASILIDTLNDAVEESDRLGESISNTNGKTFDDVKKSIDDYGDSLETAKKVADDAFQEQSAYIKGLEDELANITSKINASNDNTVISQLSQEAQELTIDLNNAKVILEQIKGVQDGLNVKITEYESVRETTDAFDELNKKLEQYGRILSGVKIGTEESTKAFEEYANKTSEVSSEIKSTLKSLATMAGIAFGVHEIGNFIQSMAAVREEFQDIESSMKVFLGNEEKATEFVGKLKDYAWYNMFEFKDLTKASQQMIAYGQDVDSIIPKLDMLSNVAAGTHAPLMEMVDAYNRAKSTGVVDAQGVKSWAVKGVVIKDVLKEMGEAASGTQITFEQLNKVLEHITGEGGMFHNLMQEQLNNISAEKGQLEDNLANMFNDIGEKLQGAITKWYKLQSDMVDNYTDIAGGEGTIDFVVNVAETGMDLLMQNWKDLMALIKNAIALYGAWRVAIVATNAVHKLQIALLQAEAAAVNINSGAIKSNTIAKGQATRATVLLDKATKAFNASMLASPWTWAAAGLAAVLYGVYKLVTAETSAAAGVRKANEALQEQSDLLNDRKDNINNLINTIKDENQTSYSQLDAYKKLKAIAPEITDAYTQQQLAAMGVDEVMKLLNKDLEDVEYEQAKKEVEEYTKKVEGLKKAIENYQNSPTQQMGDRTGAVYSSYLKSLEEAENYLNTIRNRLNEMENTRREASTPIEIKIKESEENYNQKKKILDFYNEAMMLAQAVEEADDEMSTQVGHNNETNYEVALNAFNAFYDEVKSDLENPFTLKYGNDKEETARFLKELEDLKSTWQGVFASPIDVTFRMKFTQAQQAVEEALGNAPAGYHWVKDGSFMGGHLEADTKQAVVRNKEEIQKELKQVQDQIDAMSVAKAKEDKLLKNGLSARRKQLQEELKAYSDTGKEGARLSKERADRNAKMLQDQWKHEEEMLKLQKDSARAREDASIAAIQNQSERERAEREAQHNRTIADIKAQENDIYKTIYEQRKKTYELNNKDKKYENTEEGHAGYQSEKAREAMRKSFTEDEKKLFDVRNEIITSALEKENAEYARYTLERQKAELQSMRDYLKEYGTFQQQKLAVAEEYAQKIKDAEGNEGEVLRLQAELQKKNAQIEVNAIKEGVDWNVVFGDLGNILKDQIEPTIERLERITQSEDFKALGTEEKREVYDLIKNLRTQQEEWGKVSLTEIGVLVNEYQDILARKNAAEEEEVRLQELYNKALENNLKVQNDPKATAAEKKAAEEAVKSAKKAWDESAKNVQNLGKEASTTSAKLQSASDRMRSDIERLGNALSGLTSGSLKGVYDSFSELDKMFNGGKMTAKVEELVGKLYNNLFKQDNIDYIQQLVSNKIEGFLDGVPEEQKKKVVDTLGEKISGLLDGKEGTEIKKEIGDALTNLLENPEVKDKVKEGAEEVVDTLGEAVGNGGIIGAIIALILGLLDALKEEGVGGIVAALIDMILGAVDGIIKNIISGDFVVQIVGAIVKGIGNLLNTITFGGFDSWFGLNNDNHDEMLERQAKYNSMLDTAANAVKHFTDELEKSYGFLAIQNAKQAKDAVTSTMDTIMKGIDSVMWDRYGGGSSDYFHANKALNWVGGDLERAGAVEFFKRYGLNMEEGTMRDFWSGEERTKYTWNQLFNGNDPMKIAQAFKEMRDSGNDLWRIITTEMGANDGALKEWIEKLIDAYDQLDTIEKEKLEQLTTTTSENVFDDFRNSLYELADGSEDVTEQIAQNWQKMVNEMAVNNIVIEGFRGELDEWYADLAKANEELTNTQDTEAYQNSIDALSKQYDDMMQRAGDRISQLTEMGVIKPIEESAEEGKGAFQEMTDSWVSSLMDFGATAEDWAENIGQAMAQKIINEMVVPTLIQPLLDNLQTAFDKAMEENTFTESSGKKAYYWTKVLDNEGLKAAMADINNAYPELKETVQGIMSMAGIEAKEEFSNSLDGIGDTLIDNLLSLEDDAEDIGKKVGSALIREMIEQMLASGDYAERMEAIRQMWQDVLTGKDTTHTREDVISDLRQLQEDMANDQNMTSLVSEWKDLNKELEKTKQGFSDLRSTITNSLTSAESTIEDFSKSLGKSMMSQMLDAYIDSNYKEEITALSEEWGEALASGNTKALEETQQKVISLYQTIGNEDIEVKNLTDAIKEIDRALDTTFSSMTDSWVSALMDMEGTAEQFAENVGKTMAQKIITEMVAPIYLQPLLNSMQDAYDSAMDVQGASIESVMNTMSPYLDQVKIVYNEIKPMVEGIFGGFGIYKKAAEEATEEVEYRLGDLKSNFTSALMDMENSAADFSKDISRVLAQNFIENFVLGDRFDQQMEYWKRQYESIIGSGMSEDERKRQLKALRDSIATAKQGYVNSAMAIQELLGITTEDNQEATMNMADKITYDQADQLLGINLAQELTLEQILATIQGRSVIPTFTSTLANEEMSRQVAATLQAMSEVSRAGSDNILMQLATANSHLQLIRDYSKSIRDEVLMHLGSMDMKLTNLRLL